VIENNSRIKQVLIVDDEHYVALALADNLKKLGSYRIEMAENMEEALAKIQQTKYELVITDYKMPGMNGLDLAQAVRALSPGTQVILMTGYGTTGLQDTIKNLIKNLEIGDYINKPFTSTKIRQVVEQAMGRLSDEEEDCSEMSPIEPLAHERLQALRYITGARCVLLLSSEGYLVETAGQTNSLDISRVGSLIAANHALSMEWARLMDSDSVYESSYYEGSEYRIYAYEVNEKLMLAVIFSAESEAGSVWFYAKQAAKALAALVAHQSDMVESQAGFFGELSIKAKGVLSDENGNIIDNEKPIDLEQAIVAGLVPAEWERSRVMAENGR
jgi:YesN/AraC family two-component response regulator